MATLNGEAKVETLIASRIYGLKIVYFD